jgi:hypothetical protein
VVPLGGEVAALEGFILLYLIAFHKQPGHQAFFDVVRAEWRCVSVLLVGAPRVRDQGAPVLLPGSAELVEICKSATSSRSSSFSIAPIT